MNSSVVKPLLILFIIFVDLSVANAQVSENAAQPLVVVRDGLYGYIDGDGKSLVDPQFLWASAFESGYGTVYVCGHYALIDKAGTLRPINPPRAGQVLRIMKERDKFGFADAGGQWKIKPGFDDALPFSDGLSAVKVHKLWGFIDTSGRFVIPPQFDDAFYFREGVGIVQRGDTTVLIDKAGKELAQGYEVLTGIISQGLIPVSRGGKYGYLNTRGAVAVPLVFDGAETFSEGLAAVKSGSKWGYIDEQDSLVIPLQYDFAGEFGKGLAPVKLGSETGFIDHSGTFAFRLQFEYAPGFWGADSIKSTSPFWTTSGEFGYVNTAGKVIWGPVAGSPDHAPLFGWSPEAKKKSCDVLSESVRRAASELPNDGEN